MYIITGFLYLDFSDAIPHRFDRCLGIQLGDIFSPRCLRTESDIYACLSLSNAIGIQVTHGWFTFEPLMGPVALFDCIIADVRKPWFIETIWYCRSLRHSFFCNVLQDGSKQRHGITSICNGRKGADDCCIDAGIRPNLPLSASIFVPLRRYIVLQEDGKVVTSTSVGSNSPG